MRINILVLALVLVFESFYSQADNSEKNMSSIDTVGTVKYDPVYFVLGTLNDYMGRFHSVGRGKQVDKYYPSEKPLVDYLTEYIRTELNIIVDTIFEESGQSKMYSDELSKTLNDFYGEEDKLENAKFNTKHQIYSFLAGVYYRYGEKLDSSICKIQMANSPKHQNCYDFLKQLGCENIFYKYLRNIPAQYILYFEPSDILKQYLDAIEIERVILKESFYRQQEQMIIGYTSKEDIEKRLQKSEEKEAQIIRNAFKR